ncbi:MAG: TGS domain-containing protein [Candidatus Lokiarchaeota archaeon]|nr:TGS domain-containing protein [Candidatus Lokiarchaeota archaeon]
MPINLSPEAVKAREEHEAAKTLNEKIKTLQDYISAVPKHKGTEKLLYNLKKRLVKLKAEREKKKEVGKSGSGYSVYNVKKEGAGQAVMIGLTNSGKSALFNKLTETDLAKIGAYEFTTSKPEIGMIPFEDIQIQLIELPPIYEGSSENREQFNTVRNCDLVLLVIDLSRDPDQQIQTLLKELKNVQIKVNYEKKDITVEKTGEGGIVIINKGVRIDNERGDIVKLLQNHGIHNAKISINEVIENIDKLKKAVKEALKVNIEYKMGIIIATKGDIQGSKENYKKLTKNWGDRFSIVPVSSKKNIGLEKLKRTIFRSLDIIRVYTREPGGEKSKHPIVINTGGTVEDIAKKVASTFVEHFKYAYLYRDPKKDDKQIPRRRVGINYELKDEDIIQIYT